MKRIALACCAALLALSASAANADLLLHYNFDEASGPALDSAPTAPAADGTFEGGATRTTNTPAGASAGALNLIDDDLTYAHVLSSDADKLDGLPALTLTTWLNVSEYTSGNHRLSAKQAAGTFGGFSWNMNATPNDGDVGPDNFKLALFLGNNVSSGPADFGLAYSDVDVDAADKWVFLAVTYDSAQATNNTRFYIGGENSPVTQLGGDQTIVPLTVDGGAARFGVGFTDAAPGADTSVIGYQDDVRVYDTALDLAALDAVRVANVPEPASLALLGLAGVMGVLRRRR